MHAIDHDLQSMVAAQTPPRYSLGRQLNQEPLYTTNLTFSVAMAILPTQHNIKPVK